MNKPFYITTTLPYVNAEPHVGFAMEIIRADVIARYNTKQGNEVFFNTGTDEHGAKILEKAQEKNVPVQEYVDGHAERYKELKGLLNLSFNSFIRTTDKTHIASAEAFWNACNEKGDIYLKNYKSKYCVGCELEKTDSELVDGKCPIHPDREIQIIEEENYFFRFSKYGEALLEHYKNNPNFVFPESRLKEITNFVAGGLQDFSISRLKTKLPWGIPVPGDDNHVMYVWFDALVNYISAIGWPHDPEQFKKWAVDTGGMVQYCGKDNLRQQSATWQAMLLSAGLPLSKHIIVDGFINSGGQKMSKSIGNVISPYDVVKVYTDVGAHSGADVLRYFLLAEIPTFEDGDMTMERVKESYSVAFANGIGNLTSRILTMADKYNAWPTDDELNPHARLDWATQIDVSLRTFLDQFEIGKALARIMHECGELDRHIQETEPFKLFKVEGSEELARNIIKELVVKLRVIAEALEIFIPETSAEIIKHIDANKKLEKALFPRVE